MSKTNYKTLFHLENKSISILEVKRNGIATEDKSKIYRWLLYDKANDMLSPLVFKTMKSNDEKEFREFENSNLTFDQQKGQYTEKGKTQELVVVAPEVDLPIKLKEAVGDYLLLLNFKSEQ